MRKTVLALFAIVFFAACGKSKIDDMGNCIPIGKLQATLTGIDGRKCACCGGVYITIDGKTEQFRAFGLPNMTEDELRNLNFPRRIEFDARKTGECGNDQLIEIRNYTFLP